MVCRGVACDECTKNCETFHQKQKELSPMVTRFFKIMFGKDHSKVLYLPPEFARTVKHLANQETQIEDSSGLRWFVTLSYVKGSLAFQKGWHKFFLEHGMEEGQFLVFNYIKGSHFVVQIFGKSACERINFNNGMPRQNKRSRRDQATAPEDEPFQIAGVNSGDKPISATSVASGSEFQNCQTNLPVANADFGRMQLLPISVNMEDPTCMINRDDGYYQGEDRNFLYDLSSFEMENRTHDANKFQQDSYSKLNPSRTEFMENATKVEKALDTKTSPCRIGITEQTKTMGDDTQMGVIHTYQIKGHSGDIFTDKIEKALDTKLASSHTDITEQTKTMGNDAQMAVIHTNQIKGPPGDIFTDKFEKTLDTKTAPSHTEITEQTKTKGDDTQMAVIRSSRTAGHSGDILTDKFYTKPSDNSNLSKGMLNDVSNFQNGNNHVPASYSETPSIGSSKIAEREHAVKNRCCESSVSSSVLKDPFGKHAIKKERMELEDEANGFPQVSSGKEPTMVWNHGQMFSPVVKVEPDLSYDIGPSVAVSPFSTEVKSQSYLELPVHIPSVPGRRERGQGKVVYLRDSIGRLWPVLYPNIFAVKALTSNWKKFCEQNNIKPGDKCRFQVEDDTLCIYRVDVSHRSGEFPDK